RRCRARHARQGTHWDRAPRVGLSHLDGAYRTVAATAGAAALTGAGGAAAARRALVRSGGARQSRILANLLHPRALRALRHAGGVAAWSDLLLRGRVRRGISAVDVRVSPRDRPAPLRVARARAGVVGRTLSGALVR